MTNFSEKNLIQALLNGYLKLYMDIADSLFYISWYIGMPQWKKKLKAPVVKNVIQCKTLNFNNFYYLKFIQAQDHYRP